MAFPRTADLAYWIQERYNIKQRKESGMLPPWTPDPVMATVRFCNVHREDDKVTRWIRTYYNRKHDPAWKFVFGRLINNIGSLNHCRLAPTPQEACQLLKDWRYGGNKVFSSAYIVSTCGVAMDKIDYVERVCQEVSRQMEPIETEHLAQYHERLQFVDGLGSFLAAQVVADMKNTVGHYLYTAPDWWTWCAWGPGSLKGLEAFWGRPVTPPNFRSISMLVTSRP